MNDEEAFQARLDEHRDDYVCRLVFADWLEERDDPRAAGYRALGVFRKYPDHFLQSQSSFGHETWPWWRGEHSHDHIPNDWYGLLEEYPTEGTVFKDYHSRQKADDAAAIAFSKLPSDRQKELLEATVNVAAEY